MKSVGIDIGSFSIKVAEVEATSKGYSIKAFHELPLSPDPNKDRKIEVIDQLRKLIQSYDPTSTRFVMGVQQAHVSSRHRQFPFRERHKILKSIAFELEDDIPFSQDDAIFDAKITAYTGATQAEVLALACPKDFVAESVQLASDCGFALDLLSVEGLALANLVENWQEPPPLLHLQAGESKETSEGQGASSPEVPDSDPAMALIQVGHENTLLCVFRRGALVALRQIDWGAKSIAMALSKAYNTPYVEALKELRTKGFVLLNEDGVTDEQVRFSNLIKTSLNDLTQALRLNLLEIKTEFEVRVEQAVVLGGVAQLKNIGPYITQKIEIPTNRLESLPLHPQMDFKANARGELRQGLALGLALEGLKKPRNPAVNLLKGDFASESQGMALVWEQWKPLMQLGAAAFVVLLTYAVLKDSLARHLADESYQLLRTHAGTVANLRAAQATPKNIRNFIRQQEALERGRSQAEKVSQINSSLEWLARLSSRTNLRPEWDLELRRVNIEGRQMEIEGDARQAAAIAAIEGALRQMALRGQVERISPQLGTRAQRQPFAFRLNIERLAEGGQ